MNKKIYSVILTLIMLLEPAVVNTYAQTEEFVPSTCLFEANFDDGFKAETGNFSGVNIGLYENDGESVLKADSRSGAAQLFVYADNTDAYEATVISMDMSFDRIICRGYMDFFEPTKTKQTSFDTEKMFRSLYITQADRISYFQSFYPPCGTAVDSSLLYTANKWYHFDMWIDYGKKTVTYFIDGVKIGDVPLGDVFKAVGGFRFTVESMNGGAVYYFDNIKMTGISKRGGKVNLENTAVPDGFDVPAPITFPTDKNELGFIFLDKNTKFNSNVENVTDNDISALVTAVFYDEYGNKKGEQSKNITIKSKESENLEFSFVADRFGFYYIDTTVTDENGEMLSKKKFQFSVLNKPSDGVQNYKYGYTDHTASQGHGIEEMERKMKLMGDVGVGVIRTDVSRRHSTNYVIDGSYKLDDKHQREVDYIVKNNMKTMVILSTDGKNPPVTDAEYKLWEAYVEGIAEQFKDKAVIYEVWNEYNGPGFNYVGSTAYDYVDLLKHTYPIIKRIDPDAQVNGLVTSPTIKPNYEYDCIDWIRMVFEAGGGDYMDTACIHTYTHAAPESLSGKRGTMVVDTRALLDEFGYNDMKIEVSEMGWTTPGDTNEDGQAANIVRWACIYYNVVDEVDWYVNQEKQTTSSGENGYGHTRAWTEQYAGEYPIYAAKPAFLAFSNFNALMTDAKQECKIDIGNENTYIYKFKLKNQKDALVIWNADESKETVSLKIDASDVTVYDLYGNPTVLYPDKAGDFTVDISGAPIYITGNFEKCELSKQKIFNLTQSIKTTRDDDTFIQFKNESENDVDIRLTLPDNFTELDRDGDRINLHAGAGGGDNEIIIADVLDKETGLMLYRYQIPVTYLDDISYSLRPFYFRNGKWQCLIEIKNNKLSSISGNVNIKEPKEIKEISGLLNFQNLLPKTTKYLFVNVPQEYVGGLMNISFDIETQSGVQNVSDKIYMTAFAHMDKSPEIDGVLAPGEWNKQMPVVINKREQVKLEPDWHGPADLNGKIYCQYDEENFYIAAEIEDDILYDKDERERAWAVDSIQFAFAKAMRSSAARTEYGIARVNGKNRIDRYGFIGNDTSILNSEDVKVYDGCELSVTRNGNVTTYEAKFPWKEIYGDEDYIKTINEVYFSVLINENDGAGRNGWLEYNGGIGNEKNAALFIPIRLLR